MCSVSFADLVVCGAAGVMGWWSLVLAWVWDL